MRSYVIILEMVQNINYPIKFVLNIAQLRLVGQRRLENFIALSRRILSVLVRNGDDLSSIRTVVRAIINDRAKANEA